MKVEYKKSSYNNGIDIIISGEEFLQTQKYEAEYSIMKFVLKQYTSDTYIRIFSAGYMQAYNVVKKSGQIIFSLKDTSIGSVCEVYVKNGDNIIPICKWNEENGKYDIYGREKKN